MARTNENVINNGEIPSDREANDNNSHFLFFSVQTAVSLITMLFSIVMMIRSRDNIQTFLPVMTSVSAYWLPAPKPPKNLLSKRPFLQLASQQQNTEPLNVESQNNNADIEIGIPNRVSIGDTSKLIRKHDIQMTNAASFDGSKFGGGSTRTIKLSSQSGLPPRGITLESAES